MYLEYKKRIVFKRWHTFTTSFALVCLIPLDLKTESMQVSLHRESNQISQSVKVFFRHHFLLVLPLPLQKNILRAVQNFCHAKIRQLLNNLTLCHTVSLICILHPSMTSRFLFSHARVKKGTQNSELKQNQLKIDQITEKLPES